MAGMFCYPKATMERAMKVQEVILRALAKKITWWQAAEIIGISDRQMRRERYEEFGYDGLFDRRRGKPSPYYAQLVEEGSTVTVMAGLKEVIERKGVFCALYSDRGSHFWLMPKVGGKVDCHRLTQVGRAWYWLRFRVVLGWRCLIEGGPTVGFMEDCELYGTRELIPISGGCACTSHYDYPRCHEKSRALQIFTSFIPA